MTRSAIPSRTVGVLAMGRAPILSRTVGVAAVGFALVRAAESKTLPATCDPASSSATQEDSSF